MDRVSIITIAFNEAEVEEATRASLRHASLGRSLVVRSADGSQPSIVAAINLAVGRVRREHTDSHFAVLTTGPWDRLDVERLRPLLVRHERVERPKLFSLRHPIIGPIWCAWDVRAKITFVLQADVRRPFVEDQISVINIDPKAPPDRIVCDYGFLA